MDGKRERIDKEVEGIYGTASGTTYRVYK